MLDPKNGYMFDWNKIFDTNLFLGDGTHHELDPLISKLEKAGKNLYCKNGVIALPDGGLIKATKDTVEFRLLIVIAEIISHIGHTDVRLYLSGENLLSLRPWFFVFDNRLAKATEQRFAPENIDHYLKPDEESVAGDFAHARQAFLDFYKNTDRGRLIALNPKIPLQYVSRERIYPEFDWSLQV